MGPHRFRAVIMGVLGLVVNVSTYPQQKVSDIRVSQYTFFLPIPAIESLRTTVSVKGFLY